MINLNALLKIMVDREASDLHLRCGTAPVYRVNGNLFRASMDPILPDDMEQMLKSVLSADKYNTFQLTNELDFALGIKGIGRFRVNAFRQRGTASMAIRSIKTTVPQFSELTLPEVILDLAMRKRGLILVTGTTGSGKSTLLASMINHINEVSSVNIITIEDPIEFLYRDKRSIIAQREIGTDAANFAEGIRASFRQDPDILLIGEIRDQETMETALSAADTGHLVLSTLHTMNTVETISRIVSFFPPHQHDQIRLVLSSVLVGVVSLRLLPQKEKAGRVPAAEVLINNASIAEYIQKPEMNHMILPAICDGYTTYGSQSFDQALLHLYQDEHITLETAKQNASNPDDFELQIQGVQGTSDRRWMT
ncbi:PilT/PilU family type 4a pilus ATPase [Chitinispirillales bacterium ANBcel5]|uniref:type IV pilus twitching motility protein PilT n=1 Tax=Cellulosispirillum alkaliphilum TaxID=3039283 RepID=UPI002A50CC93|nr:PilT/PilU family type 4a pilus ATPase [Chitinispirillales bacterium ANBcel5]